MGGGWDDAGGEFLVYARAEGGVSGAGIGVGFSVVMWGV